MIIIWKDENLLEIIKKIKQYEKLQQTQLKKDKKNLFFKVEKKPLIKLHIHKNHEILEDLDLIQLLELYFKKRDIEVYAGKHIEKNIHKHTNSTFYYSSNNKTKRQSPFFRKNLFFSKKILLWVLWVAMVSIAAWWYVSQENTNNHSNIQLSSNLSGKSTLIFEEITEDFKIQLFPLIGYTELKKDFLFTSLDFSSAKRSSWVLEIFNESSAKISLPRKSVFMTDDWILYETVDNATIPPSNAQGISSIKTFVVSSIHDSKWIFTGKRWDIKAWTLLAAQNYSKRIYWKVVDNFSGWDDNISSSLSKNDLENFTKIFTWEIRKKAHFELWEITRYKWLKSDRDYIFIEDEDAIAYDTPAISHIDINPENSTKINLHWNITIKWFHYNNGDVSKYIEQKALESLGSKIKIDSSSIIVTSSKILSKNPIQVEREIEYTYTIIK